MRHWIMMPMMLIVGVAGLASCGSDAAPAAGQAPPVPASSGPGSGIEVAEVFDGVEYYGACGNEVLDTAGLVLYPLLPEELDELDTAQYTAATEPAGFATPDIAPDIAPLAAPRVAPPGPGDDVGTLVVYSDGIARFESESGDVRWLTREPRTYNWVC